jgi:predicted transcriptional regulator
MPRPPSPTLTDGELRLMNVLWQRGESTVLDIQESLDEELADSTIRTLLSVLEGKGYVIRERSGRAHVYRARVERSDERSRMVRQVVRRFFRSPADLVLNLLDAGDLDAQELERIRRAIERREKSK